MDRAIDRYGAVDSVLSLGPLLLIDTSGQGAVEHGVESKGNVTESRLTWQHAKLLLRMGVPPEEIGIITPYQMQVICIWPLLPRELFHIQHQRRFPAEHTSLPNTAQPMSIFSRRDLSCLPWVLRVAGCAKL